MASTTLEPALGYCLVELTGYYDNIPVPEGRFNRHIEGICIKVNGDKEDYNQWVGNRLFWEEYQASEVIEQNGKKYSFIKITDVRGYETSKTPN